MFERTTPAQHAARTRGDRGDPPGGARPGRGSPRPIRRPPLPVAFNIFLKSVPRLDIDKPSLRSRRPGRSLISSRCCGSAGSTAAARRLWGFRAARKKLDGYKRRAARNPQMPPPPSRSPSTACGGLRAFKKKKNGSRNSGLKSEAPKRDFGRCKNVFATPLGIRPSECSHSLS